MGFPILFEHMDACGLWRGKRVKVPAITAAAVILVSRGADQILVPAPSSYEAERAAEGVERLPRERRSLVKVVDRKGDTLRRVRGYLEPLVAQAKKWPEDAFLQCAEEFLYQVALASRHKAGISGNAVGTVRGFVPILDARTFHGEARFRLGEIVSLVCAYESELNDHGAYRFDLVPRAEASVDIWKIVENTEFASLVAASGQIGYLKHPAVAFRRLRKPARHFFARPEIAKLFSLATTAANIAGANSIGEKAKNLGTLVTDLDSRPFCPPFVNLGSAELGVYRLALADAFVGATSPDGTILAFEHSRCGRTSMSWLNSGEESKLQTEEQNIVGLKAEVVEARSALKKLVG